MSLNAAERETVITVSDADHRVHIWTAQRTAIGRMRRHPAFTEVRSGLTEGSEFAEFTIPADEWNPATGAKRRGHPMTEAQRAAATERLATAARRSALAAAERRALADDDDDSQPASSSGPVAEPGVIGSPDLDARTEHSERVDNS